MSQNNAPYLTLPPNRRPISSVTKLTQQFKAGDYVTVVHDIEEACDDPASATIYAKPNDILVIVNVYTDDRREPLLVRHMLHGDRFFYLAAAEVVKLNAVSNMSGPYSGRRMVLNE